MRSAMIKKRLPSIEPKAEPKVSAVMRASKLGSANSPKGANASAPTTYWLSNSAPGWAMPDSQREVVKNPP